MQGEGLRRGLRLPIRLQLIAIVVLEHSPLAVFAITGLHRQHIIHIFFLLYLLHKGQLLLPGLGLLGTPRSHLPIACHLR